VREPEDEAKMITSQQEAAAQYLVAARRSGRPGARLPEACRPADLESALAIQQRVGALLGQEIGGWKCSLPPAEGRILAAPIFSPAVVRTSPCAVIATGATVKIEPEVAFVMGRDLHRRDTPYSEAEVSAAVAEIRLVLELIGTRYADPAAVSWHEMMADNMNNQGLFVGPLVPGGFAAALETFPVTLRTPAGVLSVHKGRHGDGHPLRPLVWLANFLAQRGEGLRAGQIVTTGSYAGAIDVPLGQPLTVTFGDLGAIAIELVRTA
jgi:2-keto-4-pentenoate hydratase